MAIQQLSDEQIRTWTLEQKDRIIYGEDSYQEQAKAPRKMASKAKPRAEAEGVTNEPKRNEETTRKQKAEFPATAQAGKEAAAANRADAQAKREEQADAKAERKAEKSDKE